MSEGPSIVGFDVTVPNAARMYNYYLGGKDNFEIDRRAAEEILKLAPEIRDLARSNREFLGRAVRYLSGLGIDQLIDIGTGLPSHGAVHEVAPGAKVVYVDNDEVVVAHANALVANVPRTRVLMADVREPAGILEAKATRDLIDFNRPFAVLMVSVLPFVASDEAARASVAAFRDAMPAGGHLVLSHVTPGSLASESVREGEAIYRRSSASIHVRSPEIVDSLFDGFEYVPPGLVNVATWRPDGPVFHRDGAYSIGGVAIKRHP